jgi:hypothetical protein
MKRILAVPDSGVTDADVFQVDYWGRFRLAAN